VTLAPLLAYLTSKGGLALLSWVWVNIAWPLLIERRQERAKAVERERVERVVSALDHANPGDVIDLRGNGVRHAAPTDTTGH